MHAQPTSVDAGASTRADRSRSICARKATLVNRLPRRVLFRRAFTPLAADRTVSRATSWSGPARRPPRDGGRASGSASMAM
jgi:hypothetical protein